MLAASLNNQLDQVNKIAIDIGGTNVRIAGITPDNQIAEIEIFKSNPINFMDTYKKIQNYINKFSQIKTIGMCIPGTLDLERGIIIYCNNLPGWAALPIKQVFSIDYPDAEIRLSNDARAAALGQYQAFKKDPKSKYLFFTTISTGIGSGYVINGKILEGINYNAGEVAFSLPDAIKNETDVVKGIEYYASGTGIMKNYPYNHVSEIEELFNSTNEDDVNYLNEVSDKLASYFATAIAFYNPGIVVVGGTVAEKNPDFMEIVFKKTKRLIIKEVRSEVEFKIAENGTEMTLIGLVA